MSYDQLAQHAKEIEEGAAEAEYEMKLRAANPPGYQNQHHSGTEQPDREEIKRKYHNTVQPLFEPYTHIPDPDSYGELIKHVRSAMADLSHGESGIQDPINKHPIGANTKLHWIGEAADSLEDWNGDAADKFKENFLGRFDPVTTNQFLILGIMKGGLEADQQVWRSVQDDIDKIAHQTMEALDNLHSCGKNDVSFVLSVVGAVAAIAAIPFTAGASAAAVAAVGAAAATGGAVQEGLKLNGGGATPEQIVKSMKTAIDKLTQETRAQQGKIAGALHAYAGKVHMEKGQKKSPFVSPRPKLADMEGKELTGDEGLGTYD